MLNHFFLIAGHHDRIDHGVGCHVSSFPPAAELGPNLSVDRAKGPAELACDPAEVLVPGLDGNHRPSTVEVLTCTSALLMRACCRSSITEQTAFHDVIN